MRISNGCELCQAAEEPRGARQSRADDERIFAGAPKSDERRLVVAATEISSLEWRGE